MSLLSCFIGSVYIGSDIPRKKDVQSLSQLKSSHEKEIFQILDCKNRPSETTETVYLWNGYGHCDSQFCLLTYCEDNAVRLREKYCKWIFDLGNSKINGMRIIDHLGFENAFSYWWTTLLVEKSPWKSPQIKDAIRLLAVEEIIIDRKPVELRLVSTNRRLNIVLRDLCRDLGIKYEWVRDFEGIINSLSIRGMYQLLPHTAKAIISLVRKLYSRWALRKLDSSEWFNGSNSIFFCSYFMHLDKNLCSNGKYYSSYWGLLPALLVEKGLRINWIHHYLESKVVSSTEIAIKWVQGFNRESRANGFHTFLDAYISLNDVFFVIKKWLELVILSWRLREIELSFTPSTSQISFWPIMKEDWYSSMRGAVAINNLLLISLFNKAMNDLPYQPKGLYLCENQAWERIFIHAWRKNGHGELIAVPHSTRSFWDIRFYQDSRTFHSQLPYPLPHPDKMAINGKAARVVFQDENYENQTIIECEALRYDYLKDYCMFRNRTEKVNEATIKVLILGDYTVSATTGMLILLESAKSYLTQPFAFTIKPHPANMVSQLDYPFLELSVVTESLSDIFNNYDIAYASNTTSASIDAYLAGLSVVVMLDDFDLNFSPLRDRTDVRFVNNPKNLALALQDNNRNTKQRPKVDDFFYLDSELTRWQDLLLSNNHA